MTQSKGILALAAGTFALGIAEFSMMGILSPIARDMTVSIADAGDFISAYAIGVSVGSPLPLLFRRQPYKFILLGLTAIICLGNLAASISPGYWTLLISRFIAGLPHGAYFGVAAIVATSLADHGSKATAVAIMVSGMTLANLAGVPAATWLANNLSWRDVFAMASGSGALAFAGIWAFVPRVQPKAPRSFSRTFHFLKFPAPWLIFAATFLGQGSVYCWYSYVEPVMLNVAHVPPSSMQYVMIVAGLGMFLGGLVSGRMADRFPASLVSCVTAAAIVPILSGIYFFSTNTPLAIALTFSGAAALFALGGPMQYLIVRFSRGGEILGGAGIQIAFNASNALSAFLGGLVINAGWGLTAPALIGLPMAVASAVILLWFYRRYPYLNA